MSSMSLVRNPQVNDDDRVVLDTLLTMLECWNLARRPGIQCQEYLWGQGWPSMSLIRNPQCPPSHWWWWGGSWHTSNLARKLNFGTHVRNHIWWTFKCQEWLVSSMSPVRNPQSPPRHWWWQKFLNNDPCPPCLQSGYLNVFQVNEYAWVVLDTLLIRLEFGTHVGNHIWRTFKMSRMTPLFHVSSQESSK